MPEIALSCGAPWRGEFGGETSRRVRDQRDQMSEIKNRNLSLIFFFFVSVVPNQEP